MTPEQKIDKVLEGQNDLKIEMAKFLVHQENHANDIKDLKDYKVKDEVLKSKAIGGLSILSVIGSAITGWLFKHL